MLEMVDLLKIKIMGLHEEHQKVFFVFFQEMVQVKVQTYEVIKNKKKSSIRGKKNRDIVRLPESFRFCYRNKE